MENNMPQGSDKKALSMKAKLIIGITAAILICALGVWLPSLLNIIDPQATEPPQSTESAPAALEGDFSVTAYNTDWEETVLTDNVSLLLNEYTPLISSVPGFPFRFDMASDGENSRILVETDAGELITWNPPDYTVRSHDGSFECVPGDTVYWSPLSDDSSAVPQCLMTVTFYSTEHPAAKAQIIISQNNAFSYNAELVSLKPMS